MVEEAVEGVGGADVSGEHRVLVSTRNKGVLPSTGAQVMEQGLLGKDDAVKVLRAVHGGEVCGEFAGCGR